MNIKKIQNVNNPGMESMKPGNMLINVLFFGQLSEITGADQLQIENVIDTYELENKLKSMFASLSHTKYIIAVDKIMITGNTPLKNNCTVALLPPFSGG